MKIAMMSYTMARGGEWAKSHDVAALCRFTRELGLDGIDWVGTYGHEPREVRRICDDHGLGTVCYTFGAGIQSPDPAERQAGRDKVKAGLEAAGALGADKVMIIVSGVADVPREETQRRALDELPAAVEMGEARGIRITIEHFPGANSPFVTAADMELAVAAVPGLKITYDNGNLVTAGEDPAEGYRRSKDHIIHAHFKDWELVADGRPGLDGRRYRGALIGEGIVDPLPCLRAMAEGGYQGYIDFEYEGNRYDPAEAMRKGLPPLLEMLEAL